MIPNVTYNNWLKWGFDGIYDFSFRSNSNQKYDLDIGKCTRKIKNFKEECIYTSKLISTIARDNKQDIWISLSGGIDSEFLANIFLESKIPFKIATIVFKNDLNDYDVGYSRRFCQQHNLKLYEFELDIEKFLENEMWDYAKNIACASPMFPSHFKLWDDLDGYIVAGHGDPVFRRTHCTNEWNFRVKENEDSVYRYFVWRNKQGAPGFYAFTPELFLSFIWEDEISRMLLFGHRAKVSNSVGPKECVYNKYYKIEQRIKQTGYEKIKSIDSYYRAELEKIISKNDTFWMPVDKLIKKLWPDDMIGHNNGNKFLPEVE
jgi:hypothetical protein